MSDAHCVACGCTDSFACLVGCAWAWVDRRRQVGLCTACVEDLMPHGFGPDSYVTTPKELGELLARAMGGA